MKRVKVKSRSMLYLGYDERKKILEVVFPNRTAYRYKKVPIELYIRLIEASSLGRFFNKYIRDGGFEFEKLPN